MSLQRLRRVLLPLAQPRAERVHELRRGLRRHGDAPARRPARRLHRLSELDEDLDHAPGGTLKGGSYSSLAAADAAYYQVNSTTTGATRTTDWYAQFSGIPTGAANLKVTYAGNDTWVSSTQNFNTLASTGTTSSTLPAGWTFSESGTSANTSYGIGTGSSNTGNTYSFGSTGSTDRAFGGLRSGALNPTIGASFTNTTGDTVTSLAISYTGEQWRYGAVEAPVAIASTSS